MKLVILDRDGVINQESPELIKTPDEWIALPGSLEAIAKLCRQEYKVIVATNQSGVGRGLFSLDTLNKIHSRMLDRVNKKGGGIDQPPASILEGSDTLGEESKTQGGIQT